jgi:indolepyruvate ferredoxin oxidoreductase
MARRIKGATKSFDACPAQHLAETQFGDAIFANMIMVGFAWQRGVIPLSSRAVYRAIKLNGVDYESNLAAFELGRRVAHDPASMGPRDADVPTPETMPLDELIAKRTADLTAYQNEAYAKRYAGQDREGRGGRGGERRLARPALTRAAAVNLYKLMAYKDEYEVARLYTDGRFAAELAGTFKGGKAKVWLAPPIIGAKGQGRQAAQDGLRRLDARLRLPADGQDEGPARRSAGRVRPHRGAPHGARPDRRLRGHPRPPGRRPDAERLPLAARIAVDPAGDPRLRPRQGRLGGQGQGGGGEAVGAAA